MTGTCTDCRFFDPFTEGAPDSSGQCKRYPPVLYVQGIDPNRQLDVDPNDWQFPVMAHDETCGEHIPLGPYPAVRERT